VPCRAAFISQVHGDVIFYMLSAALNVFVDCKPRPGLYAGSAAVLSWRTGGVSQPRPIFLGSRDFKGGSAHLVFGAICLCRQMRIVIHRELHIFYLLDPTFSDVSWVYLTKRSFSPIPMVF